MAAQIKEQGRLFALAAALLWWLQYFIFNTLTHEAYPFVWNLQLSLDKSATFLSLAICNPKPPSSLDFVTFSQPTQ